MNSKRHLYLIFALMLVGARARAAVCSNMMTGNWSEAASVDGYFAWSKPGVLVKARTYYSIDDGVKSRADDERRALLTVETDKQCLGVLEGSEKPEADAFDPFGDVSLEKLKLEDGKDFLLVKSRIFVSSITEYGALFVVVDGDSKHALKRLISKLTYESSPSGDEAFYSFKVPAQPSRILEYYVGGDKQKPEAYVIDVKGNRLIPKQL